jgi:hypothetical protein
MEFCIAIASSLPLEWLVDQMGHHETAAYLRLLKCLRVGRISLMLPLLSAFVERWGVLFPALQVRCPPPSATRPHHTLSCPTRLVSPRFAFGRNSQESQRAS